MKQQAICHDTHGINGSNTASGSNTAHGTKTANGTNSKKFKNHGSGRVFAAMASVVVAVALTACGSEGSSTTPATSNPSQSGGNPTQTGATRFNIQDSSLLYTTSEAIAISQLQSGLAVRGSALPVFVPGRNASGQSGQSGQGATMAGVAAGLQVGIASSDTLQKQQRIQPGCS